MIIVWKKLKKQPNFYVKGAQIIFVFFTNKPMILLVYKDAYFIVRWLNGMTLCGSRMLFQDIHFFYGWLSNRNSQLKINFIGLVYMVPIDAHSVSATMRITTTCSLNAPILKRSGGMFVTDATFQE
jgi:hypothetical protein